MSTSIAGSQALAILMALDGIRGERSDDPALSYAYSRPRPPRPKANIGRNDPCHCGSGKKFKKCCQD